MNLPQDKKLHFIVGFTIASVIFSLVAVFAPEYKNIAFAALGVSALAGALKEAYDKTQPTKHTVDFFDFLWTSIGGFVAAFVLWIVWR